MGKKKNYTAEDCYELWVGMGDTRSFERVADISGKSVKTIYNYSSKGKWKDRLEELSDKNKSLVSAFVQDSELKKIYTESEIMRLVDARLTQLIIDSLPNLSSTDSINDFKKLLETKNLNAGKATEIVRQENVSEVNTDNLSTEELAALADKLFKVN